MRLYPGILSAAFAAMIIAGPAYAEHQSDENTSTEKSADDDTSSQETSDLDTPDLDISDREVIAEDEGPDGFRFYLGGDDEDVSDKHQDGDLHGFARRLSITGYSGTNFTGFGDFVERRLLTGGGPAGETLEINERDFGEVYNQPVTFGFDVAQGLHRRGEAFVSFHYTYADSQRFNFMTISPADASGATHLNGEFSDYHEFGMDFGYRHYFNDPGGFTPYVGGRAGFKLVSDIDLDLDPVALGLSAGALNDIDYFDTTLTYNIGFDVGVQYWVRPFISLGVETGIHYSGDLDSDEGLTGFDATFGSALGGANDDGSRLMVPLTAKVRIGL